MKNEVKLDENSKILSANSKPIAVEAAKSRSFPEEFKKSWAKSLDKRFLTILLTSFVIVYSTVFFTTLNYQPPTDAISSKVKQQFLATVLKKAVPIEEKIVESQENKDETESKTEEKKEEATAKGKTKEEIQSTEFKEERKQAAAEAKANYQAQVNQQASAVLATLAGRSRTGRATSGSAVDALAGASSGTDLSSLLSSATGKNAADGLGLGNATRADVGRGGAGGAKLGAVGAGSGLGAGSGVGDALGRGGNISASLSTGKVQSSGASSRSVEELQSVLNEHNRAIQACYEQEKIKDPTLKGSITIAFQISKDGRVLAPRIKSSTMRSDAIDRCIINKVRLWRFSEVTEAKPQSLEIPYTFSD